MSEKSEPTASHFGLPPCLWIPIAARSVEAVEAYAGEIVASKKASAGRVNAMLVKPAEITVPLTAPIWSEPVADFARAQLHPPLQVWVHVDFDGYRKAYRDYGMPPIPDGFFLDHIQNRRAIRARGYSHPFLRLCPVSAATNSSGGNVLGGEGMEHEFAQNIRTYSQGIQDEFARSLLPPIVYADPMDLTKMLDVAPGLRTLDGVRDIQGLFYP